MPDQGSFSPKEFVEKLASGELTTLVHSFLGLAKAGESEDTFLFSPGRTSTGDEWVKIPTTAVKEVKLHQIVQCSGHTHPLVTIMFETPDSDHAEAFAGLSRILANRVTALSTLRMNFGPGGPPRSVMDTTGIPNCDPATEHLCWVIDHWECCRN
jgi:hypothetical protein